MENRMDTVIKIATFLAIVFSVNACAATPEYRRTEAALTAEQVTALAVVDMYFLTDTYETYEKFDAITTDDAVFVSSFFGGRFTDKREFYKALLNYLQREKATVTVRSRTRRDLRVETDGQEIEISFAQDTARRRIGNDERKWWYGSSYFLFRLRREGANWKIFYHELS